MTKWTYEALEQAFAAFSGDGDASEAKQRKRHKLIRAATELFASQGYRKTSVDEVAARAGVAKGTVYLYFKTKGELLLHAILEEKKRYLVQLKPLFDGSVAPPDRLRTWLRSALTASQEMPMISKLMQGDVELLAALDDLPAGALAEGRVVGLDFMSELVDQAAAPHRYSDHELRDRAQVLLGLMYLGGMLQNEKIRGELSVERFAAILSDVVVEGLKPHGGKP